MVPDVALPPLLVWWSDRVVLAGLVLILALAAAHLEGVRGATVALAVLSLLVVAVHLWILRRTRRWRRARRRGGQRPGPDESRMLVRLHRLRGAPLALDERPLARRVAGWAMAVETPDDSSILFSVAMGAVLVGGGWTSVMTMLWLVATVGLVGVQLVRSARAARWRAVVGHSSRLRPSHHGPDVCDERPRS